eukprot:Nk52_evm1s74 gene=Nk52_evmTU1s74
MAGASSAAASGATTRKLFRLALIQMSVTADTTANLEHASALIRRAATQDRANLIALPECFNSPYGPHHFPEYAEEVPEGKSCQTLSALARELSVYLVGGSIPERCSKTGKLYNTATVYNPRGEMIAKHRKIHLFDIDIPGKITFQESKTLSPGNSITTFEAPGIFKSYRDNNNLNHKEEEEKEEDVLRIGVGICYDIRFAELGMVMARQRGCGLLLYPGAFNMTTGPAHWELLARARAVDNQVFVGVVSPARVDVARYPDSYHAWGHSMVVDPWGRVMKQAGDDETKQAGKEEDRGGEEAIVCVDVDMEQLKEFRQSVPITMQRRDPEVYHVEG